MKNDGDHEDSDAMRELREMTRESLDAEARELEEWEYDHYALYLAAGQVDSGRMQRWRQYRLKLIRAVMGDERFVAAIDTKWRPILKDIRRCLKEPRACRECGTPTVFEWLIEDVCDECYSASSAVCQTCQEDDRDTIPF